MFGAARIATYHMGGGGAGASVNKSFTYVTSTESATSGTYTISIPATTQAGDIAFLFDRINTLTTTNTASAATAHRKLMLFYRPNWSIATTTIADLEQNHVASGTTVTNQTLSMSNLVEPGIGFAFYAFGTTGTLTRGSTLSTDGQGSVQEYTQGSVLYVKTFLWDQDDTATDSTISISAASAQQMGLFTFYAQFT